MSTSFLRSYAPLLLIPALVMLPACSDDESPTTPDTPDQAVIAVIVTAVVPIDPSPEAGFRFRVTVPTRISEVGGLGANINYVRLSLISLGDVVEVSEISSADYVEITGTNRLEGNASRDELLPFDFNAANVNRAELVYAFTDDRGNDLAAQFDMDFGL